MSRLVSLATSFVVLLLVLVVVLVLDPYKFPIHEDEHEYWIRDAFHRNTYFIIRK